MATYYFLDMAGLRTYDGLIKQHIATADAKSIKSGKIEDGYLKLYKSETITSESVPDFTLQLPLDVFATKVASATVGDIAVLTADGDIADSGVKITDLEIKDGSIAKAKLAQSVQDSLDKADTAVQPDDITAITTAEIQALFT